MNPTRSDFLREVFQHSEGDVWLGSLCNDSTTGGGEKHLASRDMEEIDAFVEQWDRPGRGMYFCVGTVRPGLRRAKDSIQEIVLLHADIDQKDIAIGRDEVVRRLNELPYPPSVIVDSGRGVHAYWLLREAMECTPEERQRAEQAIRKLRDMVCGDRAPCHVAAYMRLPGTHNTKNGEWFPCAVIGGTWQRYELDDLEYWLYEQPPIIDPAPRPSSVLSISQRAKAVNPFSSYLASNGSQPRIDVDALLAGIAPGNIHNTQLSVTAALINRGVPLEEVIETVMAATARVGGPQWNWQLEEKAVRRMCESWQLKKGIMS
jgi:hypothetical protein